MNNPIQTEAPQEMRVVIDNGVTLVVPDMSKPVWFGTYHTGKLGIFEAKAELSLDTKEPVPLAAYLAKAKVYICTLTETGNADFMTYAPYKNDVPLDKVCEHLLETVWEAYSAQLQMHNPATYLEAPATIQ